MRSTFVSCVSAHNYQRITLKLTYQSNAGKITVEKLSMTSLPQVLAELQALDTVSTLARKETANQVDAFSVSVCGVTWQTAVSKFW